MMFLKFEQCKERKKLIINVRSNLLFSSVAPSIPGW